MDKIYLKDNYIVTELSGVTAVFPKNYSSYSENASGFYINSTFPVNNQRTVFIDFTRVTSIYNEAGTVAYTIGTLRSYLLTNTGFKSPSGGSGGVWGSITGTLSDQTDLQTALNAKQNTLISGTNIKTINGTSLLGSGDITVGGGITVGTTAVTSGTDGRVFFQAGGVVQQDSAFFWDNTNKRLGIGATPSTSVRLDVRAQGALSTDIAFRVRNSADTFNLVRFNGDGTHFFFNSTGSTNINFYEYGHGIWANGGSNFRIKNLNGSSVLEGATFTRLLTDATSLATTFDGRQLHIGNTAIPTINGTNSIVLENGTAPTTAISDRFYLYSADRGGTAGKASAHFRAEDGTINVLGDLSGFGTSSPAARLDVRAQGALSTDIAFRVRNSADTQNSFQIDGLGQGRIKSTGFTPRFAIGYDWFGSDRNAFVFTQNIQNNRGQEWTFDAGYNGIFEGLRIFNDLTGNNQGLFTIQLNNYCFGTQMLNTDTGTTERRVLRIANGVAPTTSKADEFKFYSADIVAGNAAPHFRTENGSIIKLFKGAALTASDGTLANAVTRIAELEARLQAHGLIA